MVGAKPIANGIFKCGGAAFQIASFSSGNHGRFMGGPALIPPKRLDLEHRVRLHELFAHTVLHHGAAIIHETAAAGGACLAARSQRQAATVQYAIRQTLRSPRMPQLSPQIEGSCSGHRL